MKEMKEKKVRYTMEWHQSHPVPFTSHNYQTTHNNYQPIRVPWPAAPAPAVNETPAPAVNETPAPAVNETPATPQGLADAAELWQAALDRLEGDPMFPADRMEALRAANVRWRASPPYPGDSVVPDAVLEARPEAERLARLEILGG